MSVSRNGVSGAVPQLAIWTPTPAVRGSADRDAAVVVDPPRQSLEDEPAYHRLRAAVRKGIRAARPQLTA